MIKAEHVFDNLLTMHKMANVPDFVDKLARYSLNDTGISQRLELMFRKASVRFSMLAYGAAWEHTLSISTDAPTPPRGDTVNFLFHNFEALEGEAAKEKNSDFAAWLAGQALRDLSEYFAFHLLETYEVCLLASLHKEYLSEEEVAEAKEKVVSFERDSLRDRMKRLQKEFGIKAPFKEAILSLYSVRNVFAHSDGVVEKKHCDKKGRLRVLWPANQYFLIKRGNGKRVPYHRVKKPFSAEEYGQAQIAWLSKPRAAIYMEGDRISVESNDIQELVFFYFYIVKELQSQVVDFFTRSNVLVTPFDAYCGEYSWNFICEDDFTPIGEGK